MEKSDTIGELAKALAAVQGKLAGAKKDSENPFFKSKYADLSSVWDSCRKLLADNGLAVVQTCSAGYGREVIRVDTILVHTSGEWISGQLDITPSKNDPQGIGSALTYARRYGLSAIVGVCQEDDDAESSMSRPPKEDEVKPADGHYCSLHQTAFFKKGRMKGWAHPIGDTDEWCNEEEAVSTEDMLEEMGVETTVVEEETTDKIASSAPPFKNVGQLLTECMKYNITRKQVLDFMGVSNTSEITNLQEAWQKIQLTLIYQEETE